MVRVSYHRLSINGLVAAALAASLAGCCCQPTACNECGGNSPENAGHLAGLHHRELRKGTLPPLVPAPAVAAPIDRYHPLPTHPVFEPQAQYAPLAVIEEEPHLAPAAPGELPKTDGEPTPAPLPAPAGK